jgi:hypothetical protein
MVLFLIRKSCQSNEPRLWVCLQKQRINLQVSAPDSSTSVVKGQNRFLRVSGKKGLLVPVGHRCEYVVHMHLWRQKLIHLGQHGTQGSGTHTPSLLSSCFKYCKGAQSAQNSEELCSFHSHTSWGGNKETGFGRKKLGLTLRMDHSKHRGRDTGGEGDLQLERKQEVG